MKKNVLVVGGAGYVGGYLVDLLLASENLNVKVFDKLLYEESYMKDVDFIFGDVRDYNLIDNHLKWADTVIWIAALVGDGACEIDKQQTYQINTEAVKHLCEVFKKEIIFFSTCSVYGINDNLLTEESETNPLSTYAISKLEAERFIKENNGIIFRLGTLFGIGDKFSRIRLDLVLNILTLKSVLDKKITVFGGEQYRPLLHVKDACQAIILAINNFIPGIYNLHFDNYTIKDIALIIQKEINGTQIEFIDKKFQDLRNYRVDGTRAKNKLNFKPYYDLRYGINEIKILVENNRIKDPSNIRYTNVEYLKINDFK